VLPNLKSGALLSIHPAQQQNAGWGRTHPRGAEQLPISTLTWVLAYRVAMVQGWATSQSHQPICSASAQGKLTTLANVP